MSAARILVQDVPKHLHEATEYFDPDHYSSEIALLKDQQNNPTNLFWVSDEMAAIAVDAAQAEDFPSSNPPTTYPGGVKERAPSSCSREAPVSRS